MQDVEDPTRTCARVQLEIPISSTKQTRQPRELPIDLDVTSFCYTIYIGVLRIGKRIPKPFLIHLLSVTATFRKPCPTPGRLTQHDIARTTQYHTLGMAKDGGNLKTSWTFNIHKEGIGTLYKALELVCASLQFGGGVQEIDGHCICIYYLYNI